MIEVSCAIIVENNTILAVQKDGKSDHPFCWEFPGGKVKEHETAAMSIIREIAEELLIHVEIEKTLSPVEYDYGIKQIRLIPFVCRIKKGTLQLTEHADFRWLKASEIMNLNWAGADLELIRVNQNFFNSEQKWKR